MIIEGETRYGFIGALSAPDWPLGRLLPSWLNVVEQYGEWWEWRDVAWWHGERAAVSYFAGAVWKVGGMAMVEYVRPKRGTGGKYNGRCDLSFSFFDGQQKWNLEAEAKHKQVFLSDISKATKSVMAGLSKDVQKCCDRLGSKTNTVGILFVVFPHEKGLRVKDQSERAKELKSALTTLFNEKTNLFSGAAWFLTKEPKGKQPLGGALFIVGPRT